MLIDQVKAARMLAMKERDYPARSILTTLLGELESIAKRDQVAVVDDLVIRTCKKFIVGNLETIKLGGDAEKLEGENVILRNFIPKQLNETELRAIIVAMNATNIGEIMQQLKASHDGEYDGKMASSIARDLLAS